MASLTDYSIIEYEKTKTSGISDNDIINDVFIVNTAYILGMRLVPFSYFIHSPQIIYAVKKGYCLRLP